MGDVPGAEVPHESIQRVTFYEARRDTAGRNIYSGRVQLDSILDLTDESTLRTLGVSTSEITIRVEDDLGAYVVPNQIGNWAYEEGFRGVRFPSAQVPGGTSLVLFDGRYNPSDIGQIFDTPIGTIP